MPTSARTTARETPKVVQQRQAIFALAKLPTGCSIYPARRIVALPLTSPLAQDAARALFDRIMADPYNDSHVTNVVSTLLSPKIKAREVSRTIANIASAVDSLLKADGAVAPDEYTSCGDPITVHDRFRRSITEQLQLEVTYRFSTTSSSFGALLYEQIEALRFVTTLYGDMCALGLIGVSDRSRCWGIPQALRLITESLRAARVIDRPELPIPAHRLPRRKPRNGLVLLAIFAVDLLSRAATSPYPSDVVPKDTSTYWKIFQKELQTMACVTSNMVVLTRTTRVAAWFGNADAIEYRTLRAFAQDMERIRRKAGSRKNPKTGGPDAYWETYYPEETEIAVHIEEFCRELGML